MFEKACVWPNEVPAGTVSGDAHRHQIFFLNLRVLTETAILKKSKNCIFQRSLDLFSSQFAVRRGDAHKIEFNWLEFALLRWHVSPGIIACCWSMKLFGSKDAFDAWMERHLSPHNSDQKEYVDLAKFHIKNGFALKEQGSLLLHAACRFKKHIIVDFLIKAGADVNFRDAEGQSALNFAILQFHGGARSRPEHVCKVVDKLIQKGASLSLQDNSGRSVLHQWAYDSRFNFAQDRYSKAILGRLLDNRVPVDLVDNEGNTALMYAAAHSTGRFVMLLEATKDPPPASRVFNLDQQNFAGDTCAHLAVVRTESKTWDSSARDDRHTGDAFKLLMSMGASLHIPNNNGKTAIDCVLECRSANDSVRQVLYARTEECMMGFLMGSHIRLGSTSLVKHLHDIVVEIIFIEMRELLKSIELNSLDEWFM